MNLIGVCKMRDGGDAALILGVGESLEWSSDGHGRNRARLGEVVVVDAVEGGRGGAIAHGVSRSLNGAGSLDPLGEEGHLGERGDRWAVSTGESSEGHAGRVDGRSIGLKSAEALREGGSYPDISSRLHEGAEDIPFN